MKKGLNFKRVSSIMAAAIVLFTTLFAAAPLPAYAADPGAYSAVFDAAYYSSHYSDMKLIYGTDEQKLLQHFIKFGMKEGRQANEEFNVRAYRTRYKDLEEAFGDDLPAYYMHYINHGKAEGRNARTEKAIETEKKLKPEKTFYDNSVFIGDSVLNDFRSYAQLTDTSVVAGGRFLTMDTFSLEHALKPLDDDKVQPSYEGIKRNVWDNVKLMKADRVFLLFGVNDLKKKMPKRVCADYLSLIAKIKKVNPDVKVYVISMMPVYEGGTKGFLNKDTIKQFNQMMLDNSKANGYIYINLYESLVDENDNLLEDYCSDGYIHENHKAFKEKWEKVFTRFASEQMAAGN